MSDVDPDELMQAAGVPSMVVTASIGLALSSVAVGLVGLQNVTLLQWAFPWLLAPWTLLLLAIAGLYIASKLYRGRAWSLPAAISVTVLMGLGALGFLVVSVLSGVVSLLGAIAVPATVLAVVLEGVAWTPFHKLVALRMKLREQGYDLDF
jgi:hypothetical protein